MELCIHDRGSGSRAAPSAEDPYTKSYCDLGVHQSMLRDRERCQWYRNAIEQVLKERPGMVVLDVGTGTGLLAMFAARAGARKVYAVESSRMASLAQMNVFDNGMSDIVDVLHSRIEDVKLPEKVDLIVSEWMGHYLLHESMIDSVIFARDNFLKEEGTMLPSSARILLAPVSAERVWRDKVEFWSDPEETWGLTLHAVHPVAVEQMVSSPMIVRVDETDVIELPQVLWECDMYKITPAEVRKIAKSMTFAVNQTMRGACIWFEVSEDSSNSVLDTSPSKPETHWKQTLGKCVDVMDALINNDGAVMFPEEVLPSFLPSGKVSCVTEMSRVHGTRQYNLMIDLKPVPEERKDS
ncbi:hypothetical protein GUITHDRAFT_67464 [Guillardia theta CCMP2712]|uniref:Protein arginine N-methyltransferase domain-containing protein n=1 Tax=Guillardia theta (strain CCMP2712) TaxID=905079 RepID=L1JN29_GUITC|nr:hypothetical protein GUITHDRAFT_67464 [Guillardia theta CCMP2712]EKX49837.1 hypothetical protein GUITHDRAFT_67464 [Guillardia theta CCMP2712]|eukprot:XP_005836817.1 hypothetical protein GUITHDRAFT_67464 [Guillardia theta CCMP2712]